MDFYMILLRLTHIFSGIIWVGGTLFFVAFVNPTLAKLGADGGKFMRVLLLQTNYAVVVPVVAILTALSGILMYIRTSGGFNSDWLGTSQGIVLSTGALFGLLAAGHGLAVILPIVRKIRSLMVAMAGVDGPPSQEQMSMMQGLQIRMKTNTRIIMILMIIAVLGMSTFRYF